MMKKMICVTLTALMLLGLAACGAAQPQGGEPEEPGRTGALGGTGGGDKVQISNPFVTCDTLEEAVEIAEIELTLPQQLPDWVKVTAYRAAVAKDLIEVVYASSEDYTGNEIRIRKAPGDKDIGGVYDSTGTVQEVTVGERTVSMTCEGELAYIATWLENGYTYFVRVVDGMSQQEMSDLILAIA